ncbi:MAG TPA: ACP S-malonyltransferase, partial [Acidimicrobiia bacterium]|nr:ACP S-malonyltransferase [Acidimicrobiia bacterium]
MTYAVLFPGQGSQHVGMGADLFEARPDLLGESADDVLGWSLRSMCLVGPEESLTRTEHAQPALYALSYALWEAFAEAMPSAPSAAAGHSLGEYTALGAAGVFSFTDGLRLVATRGRAMADAADAEPSGMAALIGGSPLDAEAMAAARRE